MRQYWTLFVLGVLIFFLPFLGFPSTWKTVFLYIAGIIIAGIAMSFIMKERRARQPGTAQSQPTAFHGDIKQ